MVAEGKLCFRTIQAKSAFWTLDFFPTFRVEKMEMPEFENVRTAICSLEERPWNSVNGSGVKLDKITGGLTNILYKASSSDDSGTHVLLVRIFGKCDGLLDRELENEIYKQLSASHISPRLIGVYPWGRLEEYLIKNHPLNSGTDMISITPERDTVKLIAGALSKLHSVKLTLAPNTESANIFGVLRKWLNLSMKYGSTIRSSPRCPQFETPTIDRLQSELGFITAFVQNDLLSRNMFVKSGTCRRLLSEVLCHNDLLSGNIMLDRETNSVRLIDFEYSGLNHAVADIANVFTAVCESIMLSGQAQDVAHNFPAPSIQLHFLGHYLGYPVPEVEIEAVLTLILAFSSLDELRWTIWGVIQSNQSTVDFDYVFYYNSRFDAFKVYKTLLLTKCTNGI